MPPEDYDGSPMDSGLDGPRFVEAVNLRVKSQREGRLGSDPATDTFAIGETYLDIVGNYLYKQFGVGGTPSDVLTLWPLGSAPYHDYPVDLINTDSPHAADPLNGFNALYCNPAAGDIVVNLPSVVDSAGMRVMITYAEGETGGNTVTIDPGAASIQGYSDTIVLRKPGDYVELKSAGDLVSHPWIVVSDGSNTQKTITNAMSPYTVLPEDNLLLVDASSGAVVLNLDDVRVASPDQWGWGGGRKSLRVKTIADNAGANAVTVVPKAGEEIDGLGVATAMTMPVVAGGVFPMRELARADNGTDWYIVGAVL